MARASLAVQNYWALPAPGGDVGAVVLMQPYTVDSCDPSYRRLLRQLMDW